MDLSKKNILQIINQSRETINRKQLLVSVTNLRFADTLSTKVTPYRSSRFRVSYPWSLQIYDWHHRTLIKGLNNKVFFGFALLCFALHLRCISVHFGKFPLTKRLQVQSSYKSKRAHTSPYKRSKLRFKREGHVPVRRFVRKFVLVRRFEIPSSGKFERICEKFFFRSFQKPNSSIFFICKGLVLLCTTVEKPSGLRFAKHTFTYLRTNVMGRSAYTSSVMTTCPQFCFTKNRQKKTKNNIILSISGGQDSSFLLFCLSFLQSQIPFKPKIIWCNHFWQKGSFYTTLHLTKSAMAFSSPIFGFLSLYTATSQQLYEIVTPNFGSGHLLTKKNQIKVSTFCRSFFKKQSKHELPNKNLFYETKTRFKKKNSKAYKNFIKEISETRARNWRHISIERVCTFYGSFLSVNGHTLSDRVETILFNLIRGTKNKDFQALPWKRRHSTFCYNRFYPTFEQVMKSTHIHFMENSSI